MRGRVAMVVAALGLACAGPRSAGRDTPESFPAILQVERLAAETPPDAPLFRSFALVDAWTLEGELPERVELAPLRDPLPHERALFERIAAGAPVVATPGLRCSAQQLAHFELAHRAAPDPEIGAFLDARCAMTGIETGARWISGDVPASVSDEDLLEAWSEAFAEVLDGELAARPALAGVGFARSDSRATLVLVTARREVVVAPLAMRLPADGRVELRGTLRAPFERLEAMVGIGELGAAYCEPRPGVTLPSFAFVCAADPGDPFAWLTLGGLREGRLVSEGIFSTVLLPAVGDARTFRRRFHTSAHELGPREQLGEVFLELVNRVRQRVGAPPLVLSKPQSARASALAPHYFAALRGEAAPDGTSARDVQELVALGMAAGWDVEGVVGQGSFVAPWAPATRDVARLVSAGLELPSQRATLLDPAATTLAVGGVRDDHGGGLAAVVGSYTLFDPESFHEVAGAVLGLLIGARAERGLPAPETLPGVDALAMQAAASVPAGTSTDRALEELLGQASARLGVGVHGFWTEVPDANAIEFPESMLDAPGLRVAVGVAAHRSADQPFGRLVVLVVGAPTAGAYL